MSKTFTPKIRGTYSDFGLQLGIGAGEILARFDGLTHAAVDGLPIGATEHSTSAQQSKRVILCTSVVDSNVPQHILTDLLSKVNVDTQEVSWKWDSQKVIHVS